MDEDPAERHGSSHPGYRSWVSPAEKIFQLDNHNPQRMGRVLSSLLFPYYEPTLLDPPLMFHRVGFPVMFHHLVNQGIKGAQLSSQLTTGILSTVNKGNVEFDARAAALT